MQTRIRILLWLILITAFAAIPALSQETQKTDSAADSRAIRPAQTGAGETVSDQRLLKTLDALEQSEKALAALKTEIAARERLASVDADLLKKKDEIISNQEKLIKILEKQTGRKISFLFGLVKVRY